MIEYKAKFKVLWQFLNKNIAVLANKLRPYILGYNSYVCLISQTGTNAPTVEVLHNSLGLSLTFSYDNVGLYSAIVNKEIFESPNEYITITSATVSSQAGTATTANVIEVVPSFTNEFEIHSYQDGTLTNSVIGIGGFAGIPCILEIRKYA